MKKTLVVDVGLIRELVVILCCVLSTMALLACLALTGARAVASEVETAQAASTGMRQFYLTKDGYFGSTCLASSGCGLRRPQRWRISSSTLQFDQEI
jgi:hypothetical protein